MILLSKGRVFVSAKRLICMLGILALTAVFASFALAATVASDLATQVATRFLAHTGAAYSIGTSVPVMISGRVAGHLFNLSPQGYVLVAGDTIRVPVKAYSFNSNFSDLPQGYVDNLVNELGIQASSAVPRSALPDSTNAPYWDYLIRSTISASVAKSSYTPDTALLTTHWNQSYPYNKFNPSLDGEFTLTGCVQTAIAQLMKYHAHPASGSGVFTHSWNGQTLTAVMNRPFNWAHMPDTVDGSAPEYQQDEVAALMLDLGILNRANFGTGGTSAAFWQNDFVRAFGYAPISNMTIGDTAFFETIRSEIDNQRPVLLFMPGHLTVADGYASDPTGRKIHINLGWGGAYDDYYYLDQTIVAGSLSFPPDHSIAYNIRPCQGAECNPYIPAAGGNPPLINSSLNDLIIDAATTIRIGSIDPDGQSVTLSASSSCSAMQTGLSANLLTLTPNSSESFCQVTVQARSQDGMAVRSFKILKLEQMTYLGNQYDIGGQFADQYETDEYPAYLGGDITISGSRGYSNQAFYLWVKDPGGNPVIAADDEAISGNLPPGLYTIAASLRNPFSGSYYSYNSGYNSSYLLSVACNGLNYTVNDLATQMGLSLSFAKHIPAIQMLLLNQP